MSYYLNPFTSAQLGAAVTVPIVYNQQITEILSVSYFSSSKYWFQIQDQSGKTLAYIQPNSNGDINLPYMIDQYVLIVRDTTRPVEDIGITDYQFNIRFNSIKSTAGITTNVSANGGSAVIITNSPHVIVDSGQIDAVINAPLPAGTNNIGDVDVASLPPLPAGTNNIGDVDVLTLPSLPAGTNNIGDVDVLTLPPLPAGTNNIGDVDVLTLPPLPAGTNNIGDVDVLTLPNVTLNGFTYHNFTVTALAIKTGAGVLHSVTINTPAGASSAQLFDDLLGVANPIATIDGTTKSFAIYDANLLNGLSVVVTGAIDVTVTYR